MILLFLIFLSPLFCTETVECLANFSASEEERILFDRSFKEKGLSLVYERQKGPAKKTIFWNVNNKDCKIPISKQPKEKCILFLWEPPTVLNRMYKQEFLDQFSRVYTWNDDLVDNKTFFKFNYPRLLPMLEDLPSFEKKKFCTMVIGKHKSKHPNQLYTAREKIISFFETKPEKEFDFYGRGWDKTHSSYRGAVENKLDTIKNYRFSICFENMHDVKGYITEKIFDCFAAGSIPVYWGASNIEEYIPKECFIDFRKFASFEELYQFLKSMKKETYETYLKGIKNFLNSEKAQVFSIERFNEIFLQSCSS